MYPRLPFILLPYARLELPAWGKLLSVSKVICQINDDRWRDAPTKIIRGKSHKYLMHLDLSNWSQRLTYFVGRYYEFGIEQLLRVVLKPGDRFVDVGANIGMISLLAARLVGENGIVEAVEPNPSCIELLQRSILINRIRNINLYPVGFSDVTSLVNLKFTSEHSGTATMADTSEVIGSVEVKAVVGDDVLANGARPCKLIKIDVEGYEMKVLRGLQNTIRTSSPLLITEFIESQLRRAGSSRKNMLDFLQDLDYSPYYIMMRRSRFGRYSPMLVPFNSVSDVSGSNDVLWIPAAYRDAEYYFGEYFVDQAPVDD